eukprot:CAMPEP_0172459178 /NCGR_PEP_ID=MMETSP1065-20121228/31374_1 /TAXON_ID=265537 /ORGANISM="Amphiprora paludosa, Strain CCMP125" /LENGTH=40 /DNA_ID= /DNA_START= /DNA_END= /DNA_ORIENTATION=
MSRFQNRLSQPTTNATPSNLPLSGPSSASLGPATAMEKLR